MNRLVPERLLVFHEVVRCGGVSAAARRLHVSQPAVSGRIRDLERRLGIDLFARERRTTRLTDAGTRLLRTVERLLAVEREGLASIHALEDLSAGQLSVAASETPAHYYLLPLLARFRRLYPGVALKLDVSNSPAVVQRVVDGSHDLGFIEGDLSHPELVRTPFRKDPLRLVVSPRHPFASRTSIRLGEVARVDHVMRDVGSAVRTQVDELFRRADLSPRVAAELNKRAVVAGLGIAFVPTESSRREIESRSLRTVRLAGGGLQRTLFRLERRGAGISRAAIEFMGLL